MQLHPCQGNEAPSTGFALKAVQKLREDRLARGSATQVPACLQGLKYNRGKFRLVQPLLPKVCGGVFSEVLYTRVILHPHQQNRNTFFSTSSPATARVEEAHSSVKYTTEIQCVYMSFKNSALELPVGRISRKDNVIHALFHK